MTMSSFLAISMLGLGLWMTWPSVHRTTANNVRLSILNGRTLWDIFGEPRCIQWSGAQITCAHQLIIMQTAGRISQYSNHRALSMYISTNPSRRISENSVFLDIHVTPKAFKYTRSEDSGHLTRHIFRIGQEKLNQFDRIASLINKSVKTASEVAHLNEKVHLIPRHQ